MRGSGTRVGVGRRVAVGVAMLAIAGALFAVAVPASGDGYGTTTTTTTTTTTPIENDTDFVWTSSVPPPSVSVPATSASGAYVSYDLPTAVDDGDEDGTVTCGPASGSQFQIGTTTVNCSSPDPDNDSSPLLILSTQFTVTVTDVLTIAQIGEVDAPAPSAGANARVSFTPPSAGDFEGSVTPSCNHAPNSLFPPGYTTVTCEADKAGDTPSSVQSSFRVYVYNPATVPAQPMIGLAVGGNLSGSVSFVPGYDGSSSATYAASCVSSNGGTGASATGNPPAITVSGLDTGRTYTCTVTGSNHYGAGPASDPSNPFVPIHAGDCTDQTTCQANAAGLGSVYTPFETMKVTGTPSAATGSVLLDLQPGTLSCPKVGRTVPIANLTETGFSPSDRLTIVTTLHYATSTSQAQVCFSSAVPFRSQASATPKAGTAFLLRCSQVANVAPCVVSSVQSGSNIVVTYVVPGEDPKFCVVLANGRQVWLSRFSTGKVGTRYSAQLQSSGGKAPVSWKVASGSLPKGLTLNGKTGAITGTPATKGAFNVVLKATDSESPPQSSQMGVPITVK